MSNLFIKTSSHTPTANYCSALWAYILRRPFTWEEITDNEGIKVRKEQYLQMRLEGNNNDCIIDKGVDFKYVLTNMRDVRKRVGLPSSYIKWRLPKLTYRTRQDNRHSLRRLRETPAQDVFIFDLHKFATLRDLDLSENHVLWNHDEEISLDAASELENEFDGGIILMPWAASHVAQLLNKEIDQHYPLVKEK